MPGPVGAFSPYDPEWQENFGLPDPVMPAVQPSRSLTFNDPQGRIAQGQRRVTEKERLKSLEETLGQHGAPTGEDDPGLGERFFNTTVGKGLGAVLNNGVVKNILQPLDVLGVPHRMIASVGQELGDLAAGDGFSGKDWLDQANMDAWLDGNQEGSIGWGDVWQNHGKALGAGENEWLDAAVGLVGDIALDPMTYAFGAGVVDKGLDALRMGSRFAGAADDVARTASAARRAGDAATEAGQATKRVQSRASLAGTQTRVERVAEAARHLSEGGVFHNAAKRAEAGGKYVDNLPNATVAEVDEALRQLDAVGRKGLGYRPKSLPNQGERVRLKVVRELLDDSLNVLPPQLRFRTPGVPFTSIGRKTPLLGVPGTQSAAQGLANATGAARQTINSKGFRNFASFGKFANEPSQFAGSNRIGGTTPIDVENAYRVMVGGETGKIDGVNFADRLPEWQQAAKTVDAMSAERAAAGDFLINGQRHIFGPKIRNRIVEEQKRYDTPEQYLSAVENGEMLRGPGGKLTNTKPTMSVVMDSLLDQAKVSGVALPVLKGMGYAPHVFNPVWLNKISRDSDWLDRIFDKTTVASFDTLKEAGRQKKRALLPEGEYVLRDGTKIDLSKATIEEINTVLKSFFPDVKGLENVNPLQTNAVHLIEDYIQAVSEDVGRRAGRSYRVAIADKNVMPDYKKLESDPQYRRELYAEVQMARRRNGIPGDSYPHEEMAARLADGMPVQGSELFDALMEKADTLTDRELLEAMDPVKNADGSMRFEQFYDDLSKKITLDKVADIIDDWIEMPGGTRMSKEAYAMRQNIRAQIKSAGPVAEFANKLTQFFKTYALLTPGFHVRNGLSAMFMNAADGVPFTTTFRGARLWQEYERASRGGLNPAAGQKWLAGQPRKVQDSFSAVAGSGAGGRFAEAGVADGSTFGSKFMQKSIENKTTRFSQRVGGRTEGSVRLGMALDTIERGGTVDTAITRLTRVQFDYSQLSRADQAAKKVLPFAVFMTRNMPLQVMQQWSRPGTYVATEHAMDAFTDREGGPMEGLTGPVPDYIKAGGGGAVNLGPFNWLEPDLPHTRVAEQYEDFSNVLSNPAKVASGLNPVLTAPLEYGFNQDLYTGRKYNADDKRPLFQGVGGYNPMDYARGALELSTVLPAAWAAEKLEYRNGTWWVDEGLYNSMSAVNPVLSRADRLSDGGERGWEGYARAVGLPVRTVTQQQIDSQQWSNYYDDLERQRVEAVLNGG
jgi:hypothetical protein